ncbi:hypothetical protein NXZ81_23605 [Klebsiella pneumoniae]|nr:hypothetical protein [Klebsiella pneumoniae]
MALKKISKNARRERVFLCDLKSGGKKFTAILSPLNNDIRKSHSREWLNYMILKLKFGGPCWV